MKTRRCRAGVDGAPGHPYPTVGTASGCGKTVGWWYRIGVRYDGVVCRGRNTWWPPPRLTGGSQYPWWGDGGENALTLSRSVVEGAPGHPYPTVGTASGCGKTVGGFRIGVRYDGVVCRGRNTWWPPPRLTGGSRYPRWGDGGGYAFTSSRSVVEGAPTPGPTMDTASGCGKTVVWWYRIGVRYDGVVCRG